MLTFNSNPAIKDKYVELALRHQKSHDYVQGYDFWNYGKGSAIGCLAEDGKEPCKTLEVQTGIPEALNTFANTLFEKLPDGEYQTWAHRYIASFGVGADATLTAHQFLEWLLVFEIPRRFDAEQFPQLARMGAKVAKLHEHKEQCELHWKAVAKEASAISANMTTLAAYRENVESLMAARAAYVIAYAARITYLPSAASYIINSACNCGINAEHLAANFLRIISQLKTPVAYIPQTASK